jgi:hypothetical protein
MSHFKAIPIKDIPMKALRLSHQLTLEVCPHCGRANPTLELILNRFSTKDHSDSNKRWWGVYCCNSCGGIVTAGARTLPEHPNDPTADQIIEIYPNVAIINESIPEKPREFLRQAQNSLHAPSGAIMLCASAVDAMLKLQGYKEGTLNQRIDKAAKDHLITDGMALWAHQVRLDANDERHADEKAPLPTYQDAKLTFDFAIAFAQYLFVLPAMVSSGITASEPKG